MTLNATSYKCTAEELDEFKIIARKMIAFREWLPQLPFLLPVEGLSGTLEHVSQTNNYQFSWSVCFHVDFVAELMFRGFLTMCEKIDAEHYVLFPKLHFQRCVVFLNKLHIAKRLKKKAKKFRLSTNTVFEDVCKAIVKQHGPNW